MPRKYRKQRTCSLETEWLGHLICIQLSEHGNERVERIFFFNGYKAWIHRKGGERLRGWGNLVIKKVSKDQGVDWNCGEVGIRKLQAET